MQLDASLFGGELPPDWSASLVAIAFPGGHLGCKSGFAGDPPPESLHRLRCEIDLRDVQPRVIQKLGSDPSFSAITAIYCIRITI